MEMFAWSCQVAQKLIWNKNAKNVFLFFWSSTTCHQIMYQTCASSFKQSGLIDHFYLTFLIMIILN